MIASGEFISPMYSGTIVYNGLNSAIEFSPPIPSEFISSDTTYYIRNNSQDADGLSFSDIQISYFHSANGSGNISKLAIGTSEAPPSIGQKITIGAKTYFFNLKNNILLNNELDSVGSFISSSLNFSYDGFKNEKLFEKLSEKKSLKPTVLGSMFFTVDSNGLDKFYKNTSRLRKYGDYSVDYNNGVVYLVVNPDDSYSCGEINYSHSKHETKNKNVLSANVVSKRNNSFEETNILYATYNNFINDSTSIKILDLETSFDIYSGEIIDSTFGEEKESLFVYDDYTVFTKNKISSIFTINKVVDVFGEKLNYIDGSARKLESNVADLRKPINDGGKNYYDQNYITYSDNIIDLKKKSSQKLMFSGGLSNIRVIDPELSNIYNILDFNTGQEIVDKNLNINIFNELTSVLNVEEFSGYISVYYSDDTASYVPNYNYDYILDSGGNIFKIVSYDYSESKIIIEKFAYDDPSKLFSDDIFSIISKPDIVISSGMIQITIPENLVTKNINKITVNYLTDFSIEPGTALAIDYHHGNIVFDYTYIFDSIQVWYEYGDNSIDWSINNSIEEGELYYVTYNYGALRTALRKNFGTITGIPKLKNISLNINRETYRDFLIGVLQSFPKGPTIPAISGLIESVTKTKPEIVETFFGDWVLGRDYLDSSSVKHSGKLRFEPAKFEDGLVIEDGVNISIPAISNLSLNEGTLSFWTKPLWSGIYNDATLTFNFENIGTKILSFVGGEDPFQKKFNFDVSTNAADGNFGTDYTGGKLTIFKNIVEQDGYSEEFLNSNFSVWNKTFNITRLNNTRLSFELKQNYLQKDSLSPYLGFETNKILSGGFNVISDGYKSILIDLCYASFRETPVIFVDGDISTLEVPNFDFPYPTKSCKCSSASSLSTLVNFSNLSFDISLAEPISKDSIIYSDSIINLKPGSISIVDQEGRIYDVKYFVDNNGVVFDNSIPDLISKVVVSRFPNNSQIYMKSASEINEVIITSFIFLNKIIRFGNNLADETLSKTIEFFNSPSNAIVDWSKFVRVVVNRDSKDNIVNIAVNDFSWNYFYTDFSPSTLFTDSFSNLKDNCFAFGTRSVSSIDLRKIRFEFDNKFSLSDIYIGSASKNPRKPSFSLNRLGEDDNAVGISELVNSNEGIFVGYDNDCNSDISNKIGQWVVKVRNDRFKNLPIDVNIVGEEYVNVTELFEINEALIGSITTDGDFSSVMRGRRLVNNSCGLDNSCSGKFRYCAERLLSSGWNKYSEVELTNVITDRQLNIVPWKGIGNFSELIESGALRISDILESSDPAIDDFGVGMVTEHVCNLGITSYSISMKVNYIDPNIFNLNLNNIESDFIYSGITPILLATDNYSISVCYAINKDGLGVLTLVDQISMSEISSINFDWLDSSYHNIELSISSSDEIIVVYADGYQLLMADLKSFTQKTISSKCLVGMDNYIGFSAINSKNVNIHNYIAYLISPSIDINFAELTYEYDEGVSKIENEDIFIHESDQRISFELSSNSDSDIYEVDGYEESSDLDEIFIVSDKRRYFIDSALSESTSRISLFKDGKGFLNFRIYDMNKGEKSQVYNIATSIRFFEFGELHHIGISWRLNSFDESDEMHLFVDGYEAPNLYKFGGMIPVKLNAKFSDVSQESLQNYLKKSITYYNPMSGNIIANDDRIYSSEISGDEDVISRGIIIKTSIDNISLENKYYIISNVGPGYFEVINHDATTASFDLSSEITFSFPPTTSDDYKIKTDILNERFAINITDCYGEVRQVGGVEVGINNSIYVSSGKVTSPSFRWNSYFKIIEFVKYNETTCAWEESINNTDIDVSIITFGLKARRVSNLMQMSSSSYSTEDSNDLSFIFDKSSSISLINIPGPKPRNIDDILIKKVLIKDTVITESYISEVFGLPVCEFDLENNELFGLLSSEQLTKAKINDGRYLTIRIDSDNILFCGVDGYSSETNYVDVYGDNESGLPYERIFINSNGNFDTLNRFCNFKNISGKFSVKDYEYEALLISVMERDSIFVSNGYSTTPEIYRLIDNKLIISEVGDTYDPFEVPPGYFIITYASSLSLNLPLVGNELKIGSSFLGKNHVGAVINDFVIRNEMIIDLKQYEESAEDLNTITYEFSKNYSTCVSQNILALIKFNNPIISQARYLRNMIFLNNITNVKEKLDINELQSLILLINDRPGFESKMINLGYSEDIATRTWFVANQANGGPIKNLADLYPLYSNIHVSNSGPNEFFGESGKFDKIGYTLFNNNSVLKNDSSTIEFWVSPMMDTVYDSSVRYLFDSYSSIRTSVKSLTSNIIKLNTAASKILSIKLLKNNQEYSTYIPSSSSGVIFDDLIRSDITGVLEGGTGSDKDFSLGCTISSDGKTIILKDNLPGSNIYVVINYIPKQFSGQRISIFKDKFSRIIFRIITNNQEFYIPADIDWDRNSWHRVSFSYVANSKNDYMKAIIDGVGFENMYVRVPTYNDLDLYSGIITTKPSIKLLEQFSEITIGDNLFKDLIAKSRIDNLRISKVARKLFRDSSGKLIDQNYSANISQVYPVSNDDLTTLILDFNINKEISNYIATIIDPVSGIFNFNVNIWDSFDTILQANNSYAEDLLFELINRLKPAHTNVVVKFIERYCKN